jgi:DNA-binding HxlR family transcriptional regulator
MKRSSFEDMNCSVAQSLEIVGEWWTLLILRDCLMGVTRFDDFQQRLGIARNVLSSRLDTLVGAGVLERTPYQDNPPRSDYRLTEKGRALLPVMTALREWGDEWITGPGHEPVVAVHEPCGHTFTTVPTCSVCHEEVRPREFHIEPGPGMSDPSLLPERVLARTERWHQRVAAGAPTGATATTAAAATTGATGSGFPTAEPGD